MNYKDITDRLAMIKHTQDKEREYTKNKPHSHTQIEQLYRDITQLKLL